MVCDELRAFEREARARFGAANRAAVAAVLGAASEFRVACDAVAREDLAEAAMRVRRDPAIVRFAEACARDRFDVVDVVRVDRSHPEEGCVAQIRRHVARAKASAREVRSTLLLVDPDVYDVVGDLGVDALEGIRVASTYTASSS